MVKNLYGIADYRKPRATHGPQVGHGAYSLDGLTLGPCALLAHGNNIVGVDGIDWTVAWAMKNPRKSLILARLAGIEPTTLGFGGQYSIH